MRTYEEQKALLPSIFDKPNKLVLNKRTDGIDALIDAHVANKTPLMRVLGFTEQPWKFIAQGGPDYAIKHYPKSVEAILKILPADIIAAIKDTLPTVLSENNFKMGKHEYRLGRYLMQRMDTLKVSNTSLYTTALNCIKNALLWELKHKTLPVSGKVVLERFVQSFFSDFKASANGQRLEISFELDDILNAGLSDNGWGSCFRWGGMNERGSAYVAVAHKGGVILNYGSKGQLVGRAWVFVADDDKSVHIMKPYGFLPDNLISTAAKFLANKLSPTNLWIPGLDKDFDVDGAAEYLPTNMRAMLGTDSMSAKIKPVDRSARGWFTDPCVLRLYRDDALSGCSLNVSLQVPPCLLCGKQHTSSQTICRECWDTRYISCATCGRRIPREEVPTKHGKYVCKQCVDAGYTLCTECGRILDSNHPVDELGRCRKCSAGAVCGMCGSSENVVNLDGNPVCRKCIEACAATTCYVCGTPFGDGPEGALVAGKRVCQRCAYMVCSRDFVGAALTHAQRSGEVDGKIMRAIELALSLEHKALDAQFTKSEGKDTYVRVVLPTSAEAKTKPKSTHWSPKEIAGFSSLKPTPNLTRFCYHTNLIRGRR